MTWLSEIEKIYQEQFKDTFENLDLVRYESKDGPGMGGLIAFKNKFMKVRLLNDRGIIEIEISPNFGTEQFRYIELFNSFIIFSNSKSNLTVNERQKVLNTKFDYAGINHFLTHNKQNLENLLKKSNYKKTIKQLDILGQERY